MIMTPGTCFPPFDEPSADITSSGTIDLHLEDPQRAERACHDATSFQAGRSIACVTRPQNHRFEASCERNTGDDALDRIQRRQAAFVSLSVTANFDTVLSVRRDCASTTLDVVCNEDSQDRAQSSVRTMLDAGTHAVLVDGFSPDAAGLFMPAYVSPPVP